MSRSCAHALACSSPPPWGSFRQAPASPSADRPARIDLYPSYIHPSVGLCVPRRTWISFFPAVIPSSRYIMPSRAPQSTAQRALSSRSKSCPSPTNELLQSVTDDRPSSSNIRLSKTWLRFRSFRFRSLRVASHLEILRQLQISRRGQQAKQAKQAQSVSRSVLGLAFRSLRRRRCASWLLPEALCCCSVGFCCSRASRSCRRANASNPKAFIHSFLSSSSQFVPAQDSAEQELTNRHNNNNSRGVSNSKR